VTENRVLRNQIKGHIRLTDGERKTLAEIGKQLSKHALAEVATMVLWYFPECKIAIISTSYAYMSMS
jgi:hypothetical protein